MEGCLLPIFMWSVMPVRIPGGLQSLSRTILDPQNEWRVQHSGVNRWSKRIELLTDLLDANSRKPSVLR